MVVKFFRLFLYLTFALLFISCGSSDSTGEQVIRYALSSDPPELNSIKSTDSASFFILGHVKEGLLTFGKAGELVPGVAERWDVEEKKYVFYLRKNAKWSDGSPVTAHNFVYAWKKVVDPASASEYAFITYPILNAEKCLKGEVSPTELGVKALDDYTLEVLLERPTGYFLSLMAFGTFFPIQQSVYEKHGGTYAADADKLDFNGPFILSEWVHGTKLRMEKNPNYWNSSIVKLDGIDVPYITELSTTRMNLYLDKKIDLAVGMSKENAEEAAKSGHKLQRFMEGVLFYLDFNHRPERPTANKNLRLAIAHAFNTEELVNQIIGIPGTAPGKSLFPLFLKGVKKKFREEHSVDGYTYSPELARAYLEEARAELGEIPPLVLLSDDSENASKQAEYFQEKMRSTLGLEVRIDKQIFKMRLQKSREGAFDLVNSGWGPDYDDPLTYGDLFASWNENNNGEFKSQQYDELVAFAQNSIDQKKRMRTFSKMQRLLLQEAALIPQYERARLYLKHPKVKGLQRLVIGPDPYFVHTYIEE